jgi:uncharacterized protein YwgA
MNAGALRLAAVALLAKSRGGFGRTALMKFMYFLQVLKGVPLGYDFRLYTYGPYDAQVLEDLKLAELSHAVRADEKLTPVGVGYSISADVHADKSIEASGLEDRYRADIEEVAQKFGGRSAIDLEMAATIVFVDRLRAAKGKGESVEGIASQVKALKPRLNLNHIKQETAALRGEGYLRSVRD